MQSALWKSVWKDAATTFHACNHRVVSMYFHWHMHAALLWPVEPTSSSAACSLHFWTHPFIWDCHKLYLSFFFSWQIEFESVHSVKKKKKRLNHSLFLVLSQEYVYIFLIDVQLRRTVRWSTDATFERSCSFDQHFLARWWTHSLTFPSNKAQMRSLMHRGKTESQDNKNYK